MICALQLARLKLTGNRPRRLFGVRVDARLADGHRLLRSNGEREISLVRERLASLRVVAQNQERPTTKMSACVFDAINDYAVISPIPTPHVPFPNLAGCHLRRIVRRRRYSAAQVLCCSLAIDEQNVCVADFASDSAVVSTTNFSVRSIIAHPSNFVTAWKGCTLL